jgi:hypothetical protein
MSFVQTVKKVIKDLLTENDGQSYCPIRVFAFGLSTPTVGLFLAGALQHMIHGGLNLQDLATAFSTLCAGFAGLGAAVSIKAFTDK